MVDFSIGELRILQQHKDAWKLAKQKQGKADIFRQVKTAAKDLPDTQKMSKEEWQERKKEYHTWLKKFGRTRKPKELMKYGQAWTVRRVAGELYKDRVDALIKREWDGDPGAGGYIEHYQAALTIVTRELSQEERDDAEVKANSWNTGMLPDDLRAKNGDELGQKYSRKFAQQMWRQCGTRVVILAAWKDPNADICCAVHDFNDDLEAPKFPGLPEGGIDDIMNAWGDYSKIAFGANKDGSEDENGEGHQKRKKSRGRTEVQYVRDGIPYLPDIREITLDEAKALVREFITGYYRIASRKPGATVPWSKIYTEPREFFESKYMPPGIQLREPSKLKKAEVDRILDFWKARQNEGLDPVFEFHHTLNGHGKYVPVGQEMQGDEDEDEEEEEDDESDEQRTNHLVRRGIQKSVPNAKPRQNLMGRFSQEGAIAKESGTYDKSRDREEDTDPSDDDQEDNRRMNLNNGKMLASNRLRQNGRTGTDEQAKEGQNALRVQRSSHSAAKQPTNHMKKVRYPRVIPEDSDEEEEDMALSRSENRTRNQQRMSDDIADEGRDNSDDGDTTLPTLSKRKKSSRNHTEASKKRRVDHSAKEINIAQANADRRPSDLPPMAVSSPRRSTRKRIAPRARDEGFPTPSPGRRKGKSKV